MALVYGDSLVAKVKVIRLESSLTQEVGIEAGLLSFLSNFFLYMLDVFMLLSLSPKEGFSSAPDTAYLAFGFACDILHIYVPLYLSCLLSSNLLFFCHLDTSYVQLHMPFHISYTHTKCI